jgi:hypothetical protein
MTRATITVFASAAIVVACLILSGCSGSGGSSSTTVGVSTGYYGGSYWRDPYYRYGCCYNNTHAAAGATAADNAPQSPLVPAGRSVQILSTSSARRLFRSHMRRDCRLCQNRDLRPGFASTWRLHCDFSLSP